MLDSLPCDGSFYDEILGVFLGSVSDLIEGLERSYADADASQLEFFAHRFCSAAGTIGALRLSRRCQELEHGVTDASALDPLVEAVRDETANVLAWAAVHRPGVVGAA